MSECTCESDGIHCPHCGRQILSRYQSHKDRCHHAALYGELSLTRYIPARDQNDVEMWGE